MNSLLPTENFNPEFNTNIAKVKLFPGMKPELLESLSHHYHGIVIETYGTGGIPKYLLKTVEKMAHRGTKILITTQVAYPYVDLVEYEVGIRLNNIPNVYNSMDMSREAAVTKFMWSLSQKDPSSVMNRCYRFECYSRELS